MLLLAVRRISSGWQLCITIVDHVGLPAIRHDDVWCTVAIDVSHLNVGCQVRRIAKGTGRAAHIASWTRWHAQIHHVRSAEVAQHEVGDPIKVEIGHRSTRALIDLAADAAGPHL